MSDNLPAGSDSVPTRSGGWNNPKIDVAKALKLRMQGLSYSEIACQFDCAPQSVQKALAKFTRLLENPEAVNAYRDNEADLLDAMRMKIVGHMAEEPTLKKASLNNSAFAFSQLLNGSRLLRGQSTANIHQLTSIIEAADYTERGKSTQIEQEKV